MEGFKHIHPKMLRLQDYHMSQAADFPQSKLFNKYKKRQRGLNDQ